MIQYDLFESPEITIDNANRTWKDDVIDWWKFNNWKPVVGISALIDTVCGFCIEDNTVSYCCFDTGIITEINNEDVIICINGEDTYFKKGKHYKINYYNLTPVFK